MINNAQDTYRRYREKLKNNSIQEFAKKTILAASEQLIEKRKSDLLPLPWLMFAKPKF